VVAARISAAAADHAVQVLDHVVEIAPQQAEVVLLLGDREAGGEIALRDFAREEAIGAHDLFKVFFGNFGSARGAQLFVGALLLGDLCADCVGHLVETARQLAEFIATHEAHTRVQVAGRNTVGGCL
jgi:hypothetical protein